MTYITPGSDPLCRLSDALGLERCREATLRMAVNDVVTLTATTYATVGQAENLVEVIKQASVVWWIPVEERLPDPDFQHQHLVAAINMDGERYTDTAYYGREGWLDCGECREPYESWGSKVYAWMPLPEAPEVPT